MAGECLACRRIPTCRGQNCDCGNTCATCNNWDDAQWMLFFSRRTYKKKSGQSVPVLGGGSNVVNVVPQAAGANHQPRMIASNVAPKASTDLFTISPTNVLSQHRPMWTDSVSSQHRPMLYTQMPYEPVSYTHLTLPTKA